MEKSLNLHKALERTLRQGEGVWNKSEKNCVHHAKLFSNSSELVSCQYFAYNLCFCF